MKNGARPCVACACGYTSVHVAVLNGARDVLNSIIKHCNTSVFVLLYLNTYYVKK